LYLYILKNTCKKISFLQIFNCIFVLQLTTIIFNQSTFFIMKKFFFLLALLFSVTVAQNAFAAGITVPAGATTTATTEPTKETAATTAAPKKVKFFSKANLNKQLAIVKQGSKADNYVLALILCAFLGTMGIHRAITGTPISILWYLLTFGGIFGIIPLCDFIFMLVDGNTSRLDGNPSLFACFGGGGK
jgi:TM2 domain-containing membrane protein YozV